MLDIDKVIQEFHEKHEVVYSLVATVDGEVVVNNTSSISADDVAMFAYKTDSAIGNLAVAELEGKADADAAVEADNAVEESRE